VKFGLVIYAIKLQAMIVFYKNISILIPALPKEKTPIKPVFFSCKSMTEIIKQIKDMGGQLNSKDKGWKFNPFIFRL